MDIQKLIKGCIKQDRRSQNELYRKFYVLMSSVALRYAKDKDEAMQFVNGGYFKIFENIEKYKPEFPFEPWARKILVNHIIDEMRKESLFFKNISLTEFYEEETDIDQNLGELKFDEMELRFMLSTLSGLTHKVFNMFAIDGFKHREIAEILGIPEGTSKWYVNEARKQLKIMIECLNDSNKDNNNKLKMKL